MFSRPRRLLLIPAVVLVLLGAPALAVESSGPSEPATTEVELALPPQAGPGAAAEANTDAQLVGVTWSGDSGAEFQVEVKRPGSEAWEPAGTLGGDDTAPDDGSPDADASQRTTGGAKVSEPLAVGDADDVRITVVTGVVEDVSVVAVTSEPAEAPSGSAGALGVIGDGPDRFGFAIALVAAGAVLGAFAAGWSPWRSRRQAALLAVCALVVLAACEPAPPPPPPPPTTTTPTTSPPSPNSVIAAQPSITMRSSWGPDLAWNPSPDCAPGPEIIDTVRFLVVHHTVNSNDYTPDQSREWIRNIWSYHRHTLGYCDIAYNFIIDKYGQIFEGRQGGIEKAVLAAHTGGFNRSSTGVALLGNHTSVQPTTAAWNALVDLSAWKLSHHRMDPAAGFMALSAGGGSHWPEGTWVSFQNRIVGHRDLWPTACPGDAFYPRLGELRAAVQPKVGWGSG